MHQLGHEHRPTTLGEKQQGHRGGDVGTVFARVLADPVVAERILLADEKLGPLAVPIVVADEPPGGESADAFQAVEIIVVPDLPHAATARIAADREVAAQPPQCPVDRVVFFLFLATLDEAILDGGVGRSGPLVADDGRADAGAGHAAQAFVPTDFVAPRAVGVLAFLPIVGGLLPGKRFDLCPGPFCLMQGQHRELRVAVVAIPRGIRPSTVVQLHRLEPIHVPLDENLIASRVGGAEDHRLQGDTVGLGRGEVAQIPQRGLDLRMTGLDPRIQQGQRAERSHAPRIRGQIIPRAAGDVLLFEQIFRSPLDRFADPFGGQRLGDVVEKLPLGGQRNTQQQPGCGQKVPPDCWLSLHAESYAEKKTNGVLLILGCDICENNGAGHPLAPRRALSLGRGPDRIGRGSSWGIR